jgi:hypothetical protein
MGEWIMLLNSDRSHTTIDGGRTSLIIWNVPTDLYQSPVFHLSFLYICPILQYVR